MSKMFKINDTDFTHMFTSRGYMVQYQSVQGNNAGQMLDGSYMEDELAVKAVVKLNVLPLNEDQVSALLQEIYAKPYVTLYYFDPKQGAYLEKVFRRNATEQKYRGFGSDGKEYWTAAVLTLTEK